MTAANARAFRNANSRGAISCSVSGKVLQTNSAIVRMARALWPTKPAMELMARTSANERMVRYWLSEKYSLSAENLAELLRSDAGLNVLEAVMGDARPVWWERFKRTASLAALRQAQDEHRKKIEQLELEL